MDYIKSYTIRKGDTLSAIAKRYETTVNHLARMNNIADPDKLFAGDELNVPDVIRRKVTKTMADLFPSQEFDFDALPKQTMAPSMPNVMPSLQQQALQPSSPETALMGLPGLGKAAMGGLTGMAKAMPPMAKAGRLPPPQGFNNVLPMGNNMAMNRNMTQAITNNVPNPLAQMRNIPTWLRDPRTAGMMKGNPTRFSKQLTDDVIAKEPPFGF